ncbi:hypothetical protein Bca4012_002768 [Brassica carinata]
MSNTCPKHVRKPTKVSDREDQAIDDKASQTTPELQTPNPTEPTTTRQSESWVRTDGTTAATLEPKQIPPPSQDPKRQ